MYTSDIDAITESFSDTEKDLWNIVTKRIDFDYADDSFIDSLKNLIPRLVVEIAPFYDPETYQSDSDGCHPSLDVKHIKDEPAPIVNYIESAVIEHDLKEYLRENTELGNFIKENRGISRRLFGSMVPGYSDENPEMEGIEKCVGISHGKVDITYRRSWGEISEEIKTMMESEFKDKATWNKEEQQRTIRRLKARQLASYSRHEWHYQIIDFIEWYCLKNNMPFFLTEDLYFSDDDETVFDTDIKTIEKDTLIEGIAGRMLMHVGRYGTENADSTIKRYAEILQVFQNHKEDIMPHSGWITILSGYYCDSIITLISKVSADLALLSVDKNAEYKGDTLLEFLCGFRRYSGEKWFNDLYKELAEVTGIKASPIDEKEDDSIEINEEEPDKDVISNCYIATYPVIGIKKAQEAKEDVFNLLNDFNYNDRKKYLEEGNRKVLYNAIKEAFEKHLEKDIAEWAAYCLFRSLMEIVHFPCSDKFQKIRDDFNYGKSTEIIDNKGYHPSNLWRDSEKKYAEIIRGFGFNLNAIQINRAAGKITEDSWTLKRVIDGNWSKNAHDVLHDIIQNNLKECYSRINKEAVDTVYREVCKEFDIAPMV